MNESFDTNEPHDWPDRLIDQALRETVGGETPPDLSEAILAAADAELSSPRSVAMSDYESNSRRFGWSRWVVAASALLLVGTVATTAVRNARMAARLSEQESEGSSQGGNDLVMKVEPQVISEERPVIEDAERYAAKRVKREASVKGYRGVQSLSNSLSTTPAPASVGAKGGARRHSYFGANGPVAGRPTIILDSLEPQVATWGEPPNLSSDKHEWYLGRTRSAEGRGPGAGGDQYDAIHENPFIAARGEEAVSTFSIDVDTASYTNVRQFLNSGHLPPPDAVRLEELINYFDYDYQPPSAGSPFAADIEVATCPWKPEHKLVRIGVKGREIEDEKRPLTNLVFLIDVSGSMNQPAKHALVIEGLKALTQQLGENDRVAIVVYASQEGLALPSVTGSDHETILAALDNLRAGGSTAGGAGIRLAYQVAEDNFIQGGANRVILCTDGDFNVGTTSTAELERLVAQKAKETGVFLSVCGFGRGNLNDAMMETITNKGNGNYYYVDSVKEAEKVFVKGLTGTLVTIAKDVKIQVEFNPANVAGYRLLGYENRMLRTQDFNDDRKDAGEIGAGHTVTALYEIVLAGEEVPAPAVDELKYQQSASLAPAAAASDELLTLKMRFKKPDEDVSSKLTWPVADIGNRIDEVTTSDFQFAAAVASFGMQLRGSKHAGDATLDAVLEIAESTKGKDPNGYRAEFVELVKKAKTLRGK